MEITLNFHPDRLLADHRTVAEHLAADGVYRSQFETGISNGGLGGPRLSWEERMFPGRYTGTEGRPVYGALNVAGHPDGASPRFGSCHLVCDATVAARTTFTLGDSVTQPDFVDLADIAAVPLSPGQPGRVMDGYIEAQIHGGLTIREQVKKILLDPSYLRTPEEHHLSTLGPPVHWTPGFRLAPEDYPAALRGPEVPPLARHVADRFGAAMLDARVIGLAAQSVVRTPGEWAEYGSPAEVLQLIKYLWHVLVILGESPGCSPG